RKARFNGSFCHQRWPSMSSVKESIFTDNFKIESVLVGNRAIDSFKLLDFSCNDKISTAKGGCPISTGQSTAPTKGPEARGALRTACKRFSFGQISCRREICKVVSKSSRTSRYFNFQCFRSSKNCGVLKFSGRALRE